MELKPAKGGSTGLLHVVTTVDEKRGRVAFSCESNPLTSVRSFDPVLRCPFCRQPRPLDQRMVTPDAGMSSRECEHADAELLMAIRERSHAQSNRN